MHISVCFFLTPLLLYDPMPFELLGEALPFVLLADTLLFLESLSTDSCRYCSIQALVSEKPQMVNHCPTICSKRFTACSSLSVSTDSKVQWNWTSLSLATAEMICCRLPSIEEVSCKVTHF